MEEEKDVSSLVIDLIKSKIEELSYLQFGSEEHSRATEDLVKLIRARIEEAKVDTEYSNAFYDREIKTKEASIEQKNKEHQQILQLIELGVKVILTTGGGLCAIWMFVNGLNYEKTGLIMSKTMNLFLNKGIPPRK